MLCKGGGQSWTGGRAGGVPGKMGESGRSLLLAKVGCDLALALGGGGRGRGRAPLGRAALLLLLLDLLENAQLLQHADARQVDAIAL